MSASQSNLSDPQFGYDIVAATTQASINTTLDEFISNLTQTEVTVCFVDNGSGTPVTIDYDTLKQQAGADPFAISNGSDPGSNPGLQNLVNLKFLAGFQAQIGLPEGIAINDEPDMITLGDVNAPSTITLLCSTFTVVQYNAGASPAWTSVSQPSGSPWLFTANVNLSLVTTPQSAYNTLPAAVKQQVSNLGSAAFTVQQLLFDFSNATLDTMPQIPGVISGSAAYTGLQDFFVNNYFSVLQQNGQPTLGCAIMQDVNGGSSLTLTNFSLQVDPFIPNGQQVTNPADLSTLNFLCAANGHSLPPAALFTWNWADDNADEADFDGVMAINRFTFCAWLANLLSPALTNLCMTPQIEGGGLSLGIGFVPNAQTQQYGLVVDQPAGGDGFVPVLTFSSTQSASKNDNYVVSWANTSCAYTVASTVYFSSNQIKIFTTANLYCDYDIDGAQATGNLASYSFVNLYTVSVDPSGKLGITNALPKEVPVNLSEQPQINTWVTIVSFGFLGDATAKLQGNLEDAMSGLVADFTNEIQDCLNGPQSWIFPGGKAFVFKDAGFSNFQDLVAHITYASN